MGLQIIGILALLVGLVALKRGPHFAFKAFVPFTLLGASAAVLLPFGTIQPAHFLLGFLALTVLSRRQYWGPALRSLAFPNEGFWLLATVAYAVLGSFLLPRIFAGVTEVNAIGSTEFGPSLLKVPLGPTSGNMTQSIYVLGDLVCFLLALTYCSTASGFVTAVRALLAFCIGNVVFAVLDIATFWTHTAFLLDPIRNANYVLHDSEMILGLKRIIGSFTEAASFAYATLGSLGFTARLWLAGYRPGLTLSLTITALALLLLSTSSTAYVATPVLLVYVYLTSLGRVAVRLTSPTTIAFLVIAPLAAALLVSAIALDPVALDGVRDFLSIMLFDKSQSQSGVERGHWNAVAFQNFLATGGLGGGLGSIRASSFPVALLSNLGIPGTLAFGTFLAIVLLARRERTPDPEVHEVRQAARTACIGLLLGATVSGTLVDLGLPFFVFAALACASPSRTRAVPDRRADRLAPSLSA